MAESDSQALSIKITNLSQIKAAFNMAPRLMTQELNIAIKKSIFSIQRQSMIYTPVDTGRLRSSTKSKFENLQGTVGTNTDYDYYVHWGTRYMQARPYLLSAVVDNEKAVEDYFVGAVDNVLNKIGQST